MRSIVLFLTLVALVWAKPAKQQHNPMINEGLFEGDIMGIDPYQDRNAIPRDSQRWVGGVVPYVIEQSLNPIRDMILKSMKHIQDNTCIRFKQRTNERDYVSMYKGNGCWSYWGRTGGGEQKLSLGTGCEYFGTVVHEFLHAIGFEHEHNRSDRDGYLDIHLENVAQEWHYAFKKLLPHENRLLSGFDFESVMLYGSESFAKSWGLKSMTAKDGRHMKQPFDKPGMSKEDIKRINILYNC
ncbi:hypothetical protein JTE90_016161 [Oedothorax gibbosus]|uniref:Metalloendopeptidase n=1 Tax=Oedothorax gibbosus TaxID=931172 RepID=A0AAV6UTK5_9ARAC|nr:hypothetical protein JTE90_016161 [Oedothorax gibbosus]